MQSSKKQLFNAWHALIIIEKTNLQEEGGLESLAVMTNTPVLTVIQWQKALQHE